MSKKTGNTKLGGSKISRSVKGNVIILTPLKFLFTNSSFSLHLLSETNPNQARKQGDGLFILLSL